MKKTGTHFPKESEIIFGFDGSLMFNKGWLYEILQNYIGSNGKNTPDTIE